MENLRGVDLSLVKSDIAALKKDRTDLGWVDGFESGKFGALLDAQIKAAPVM